MVEEEQGQTFGQMKIIIDTNIIFSVILNTNSRIGDILLNSDDTFKFYSVNYLKEEINNHKEKLNKISKLSHQEIDAIKTKIYSKINFISEELISSNYWEQASEFVKEVDMDDIAFVALSIYLEKTFIWTGDKKLQYGIKKAGYDKILNTQEIFNIRKNLEQNR